MDGSADRSRREFLAAGFGVLLSVNPAIRRSAQDSLADAGPSGKLWDPARAGLPVQPVTAGDNDAAIQAIEKRLKCTCGCNLDVYTCRTTDFTCTTSPAMHREVLALAAAGLTAEHIVASFVTKHGQAILMAPPKRGFNLAGYFVPAVVILAAGTLLVLAMRRWVRRGAPSAAGAESDAGMAGTAAELERLRRELERVDA
ncbi:MAG: cytochrome c-type biogenesis protein CcmH [Gemmatimonadales bacterium]